MTSQGCLPRSHSAGPSPDMALPPLKRLYVLDLIVGTPSEPNRWVGASAVKPKFDSRSLRVVTDVRVGFDVVVYIQLFRPPTGWDEPPVYQVVVGRLKTS